MVEDTQHPQAWVLAPPSAGFAFLRFPSSTIPAGARQATALELFAAGLGRPFPWGNLPEPPQGNRVWKEHRLGMGGLVHDRWFVTTEGRFGGAKNVPAGLPGSLRASMRLDGGRDVHLADNEGFAVVRPSTSSDREVYRDVQLHALEHVVADGGEILVSPVSDQGIVYVGFTGRCLACPNPERVSFRQLVAALPQHRFELFEEWRSWSL